MIEEPPTFEISYTKPFVAELRRHYRRSGRLPWLVPATRVAVPLALCGLGAWIAYPHRHHLAASGVLGDLAPLAAFLVLFVSFPWLQRLIMYSRVRKSPMGRSPVRLELTPQGVSTSMAVGSAQMTWAAFPKARQFEDGFLLFQGPRAAFWLPLGCMVAGQPADVEELLRANVADFRRA